MELNAGLVVEEARVVSRDARIAATAGGATVSLLYVGCVVWDLLFPTYAMNPAWAPLFPGFTFLTWGGFLLGLAESLIYGALLGWLIVWMLAVSARAVPSR